MRWTGVDVSLVVPPADQPGPEPVPSQPAPPPAGQPSPVPFDLPRTGVELVALLVLAVALIALGAVLVRSGLSRRSLVPPVPTPLETP